MHRYIYIYIYISICIYIYIYIYIYIHTNVCHMYDLHKQTYVRMHPCMHGWMYRLDAMGWPPSAVEGALDFEVRKTFVADYVRLRQPPCLSGTSGRAERDWNQLSQTHHLLAYYRFGTTKPSTEHRTLGTTNSSPSSSLRQELQRRRWSSLEHERLRPPQASSRLSSLHKRNAAVGTEVHPRV